MLRKKKSPFIMVMMPHLIVIEDGKIINDGYLNYDVPNKDEFKSSNQ
jgi:hypothetical protein